mgnify:CR=1 FL=1
MADMSAVDTSAAGRTAARGVVFATGGVGMGAHVVVGVVETASRKSAKAGESKVVERGVRGASVVVWAVMPWFSHPKRLALAEEEAGRDGEARVSTISI